MFSRLLFFVDVAWMGMSYYLFACSSSKDFDQLLTLDGFFHDSNISLMLVFPYMLARSFVCALGKAFISSMVRREQKRHKKGSLKRSDLTKEWCAIALFTVLFLLLSINSYNVLHDLSMLLFGFCR